MTSTEATSSVHSSLTIFGFLSPFLDGPLAFFLLSFHSFWELSSIFSREGLMSGDCTSERNVGFGEGHLG